MSKKSKKSKVEKPKAIRIITDPDELPNYQFPYGSSDSKIGYSLIQAAGDTTWEPRWCLIDMYGNVLAILEADSFDDISPEILSEAASNFVMELHDLGEEDTGTRIGVELTRTNNEDSYSYDFRTRPA